MKTNEEGVALIKAAESLQLKKYKCPAGIDTIGYGTTGDRIKNIDTCTEAQAEAWLKEDIENKIEKRLATLVSVPLNENQFSALVSFCYNVGCGAFSKSTLRKVINSDPNNFKGVEEQFMKWCMAGGKRLKGLERRRAAEYKLYATPVESNGTAHKCRMM